MSRINTNIAALTAARVLNTQNEQFSTSLQRLSTGYKINNGADNPSGLIVSENLRSEKRSIEQAITNAERADTIVGTADGALIEVGKLLVDLQGLIGEVANEGGLSTEEIEANQLQVDSIVSTINRISQSTTFQGTKLLDGNFDFITSGVTSTELTGVSVNAARFGSATSIGVDVEVTASAQLAELGFAGPGLAAANDITIEVAGNLGSQLFSFQGSATTAQIRDAINQATEITGVSASLSTTGLVINSQQYGSSEFVSVTTLSGTFASVSGSSRAEGVDVAVNINGNFAQGSGLDVSLRTAFLDVNLELGSAFATALGASSFDITGGGAKFQISPKVSAQGQETIGIKSVAPQHLGKATDGHLNDIVTGGSADLVGSNALSAQKIVDAAAKQISSLRGRLGAFQKNTLGSTINSLQVALENASAAESAIRDTDFASETANLTRSQILVAAATNALGLANNQPQNVLRLLG